MSETCMARTRDDGLLNVGEFSTKPAVAARWTACTAVATHQVEAACIHEHVLSWEVCDGCAAGVLRQAAEPGMRMSCPSCQRDHYCPVQPFVRPLESVPA